MYRNETQANAHGFIGVKMRPLRPAYRAPSMSGKTKASLFCIACAAVGAVYMLAHFLKG